MRGAEQRAETIHWGEIRQGASEIKDLLHQVLPASARMSFRQSY